MDKFTAEIIKNQMVGHVATTPNSPVLLTIFEIYYYRTRKSDGTMYEWDDCFIVFIEALLDALNVKDK